jgi:TonB-linked SusC/RagA family outer membrane protein
MKRKVIWAIGGLICLPLLLCLFIPEKLLAGTMRVRQVIISGKVTDQENKPVSGVSVKLKGAAAGTLTNEQGNYTLSLPKASGILVFSYVGYETREIQVSGQEVINVQLTAGNKSLEEIVVVGYGTRKKRDVTGSIASVSSQQINQVVANNPVQALQGRVAGVNISQDSWRPGGGSTIRIRGTRSIRASNTPLYVVDGNPISRGDVTINDINPSDIESMEILKDASATAIYGSRGANGVILITTRRGKAGKTTVDFNSYEGYQNPLRTVDIWDGAEYADYVRDSYRYTTGSNKYNSPVPNMDEDKANPQFALSPYVLESVLMGYDANGNYDPSKVRSFDWMDAVMQTGRIQSHQVGINGGSEKTKASVSAGYFRNKGIVKNMDYNRVNLRINLDHQVASWLKLGTSSLISRTKENIGSNLYSLARSMSPLASPYGADGDMLLRPANDPLMLNPLLDIEGIVSDSWKTRVLTNINMEATLARGLKFRSNFGYDYRTARDGRFEKAMSTPRDGGQDFASYGGNIMNDVLLENMLFYEKSFGNDHKINVTLLESTQDYRFETNSASAKNLPYQAQEFYNLGSANDILGISTRLEKTRMLSFMARVDYDFKNKYLLTLTGRRDASSVLAEGNKSNFFPSAAFAWRISSEKFAKESKFIDDLKLRLSYGRVGNSSVAPYQTQGNLGLVRYVWDESAIIGYAPNLMPNPDLSWEVSATADIGLDFSFFNGRLSGTVEGYQTNTSDLIMPRKLPITSGFPEVLSNVGSTRNRGIEVTLSTENIRTDKLNWKTAFTFARNKEEITELISGKVDDIGNGWFIGQPPTNVFYDQKVIGIWQNTPEDLAEMAKFNANGHNFQPGFIKLADLNSDYRITTDDRYILGSRTPKFTAGLSSDLTFKQFDFSVQLYMSQGAMGIFDKGLQLNGRQNMVDVDYWTPDNPSNTIPKVNAGWLGPDYTGESYYEEVSYFRVKYITLGYSIPSTVAGKLKLRRLRLYASAQNPYLYSKFTGLDPEGAQGFDAPSVKTFMLGLNATF